MADQRTSDSGAWMQTTLPRWLMLAGLVGVVVLALILPPPLPDVLLIGSLLAAVVIGVRVYGVALLRDLSRWLIVPHPRLFVLSAVALCVVAAYLFIPNRDAVFPLTPAVAQASIATLGGWFLLSIGLSLRGADDLIRPFPTPTTVHRHPLTDSRRYIIGCGVLLLWIGAESSGDLLRVNGFKTISAHLQFALLAAGALLVTWGFGSARRVVDSDESEPPRLLRVTWGEGLLITAIALLALFLRWWELHTRLPVLVDELNFISHVMHFWELPDNPMLRPMTGVVPFTRVFSYWESWAVMLIGRDFTGMRAVSGIIGTLNVVALWWLARHLFDRRVALLAALILTTFPPHIHFSSLALNNIVDPVLGTLALAFLARALRGERRIDYALAGLFLGMVPYFYEGGRYIFPILVVLYLVWVAWFVWRREIPAGRRGNLLALALVAALVAFPVYYNLLIWTGSVSGRMQFSGRETSYWAQIASGDADLKSFVDNIARAFLFYINRFENFIHYGSFNPLILPVFVPLFLLGLGYAVWGTLRRHAGAALVLLWFVLVGFGNSFLVDPGVSTRHVVGFPVASLLMAMGLWWSVAALVLSFNIPALTLNPSPIKGEGLAASHQGLGGEGKSDGVYPIAALNRAAIALTLILAALMGARQVDYYYNDHLPLALDQIRDLAPYRDVNEALMRLDDLPDGAHITVISDYSYSGRDTRDMLIFFHDGLDSTTIMNYDIPDDYFVELDPGIHQAFFVPPDDDDTLALIEAAFGALGEPQYSPNNLPLDEAFIRYDFPPSVYNIPVTDVRVYPAQYEASLREFARTSAFAGLALLLVAAVGRVGGWSRMAGYGQRLRLPALPSIPVPRWQVRPRPRAGLIALVVSGCCFALATWALAPQSLGSAGIGAQLALVGGVLLWAGMALRGVDNLLPLPPIHTERATVRLRPIRLMMGLALVGLVTLLNLSNYNTIDVSAWEQAALFIGGVALVVWSVRNVHTPPPAGVDTQHHPLPVHGEGESRHDTFVDSNQIDGNVKSNHDDIRHSASQWEIGRFRVVRAGGLNPSSKVLNRRWLKSRRNHVSRRDEKVSLPVKAECLRQQGEGDLEGGVKFANHLPYLAEGFALVLIISVALAARVMNLEYAVHRFVDEMHSASAVANLNAMPNTRIFLPHGELTAFTWLYPLLQQIGYEIYGAHLTALRVVSALMGTATVFALWGMARTLFDRQTALLAALILAVLPPHIHFSRIGLNNVADPLFGTLALWLLVRGFTHGKARDFALGGVMLGMTQYFYEGGRLLFPPLILAFVVVWLLSNSRRFKWRGALIFALTFALTAAPVLLTWHNQTATLTPRLDAMSADSTLLTTFRADGLLAALGNLPDALHEPLWVLVQLPDSSWFYGGDSGLLVGLMLPLFLIGTAVVLRYAYQPRMALLLLWLALTLLGNSLLKAPAEVPRYVVVLPALALIVALGLRYGVALLVNQALTPKSPLPHGEGTSKAVESIDQRQRLLAFTALMLMALAVSVGSLRYYFESHLPTYNNRSMQATIFDDVLFRLVTLPPQTYVFIVTDGVVWREDITDMLHYAGRDDLVVRVVDPDLTPSDMFGLMQPIGRYAFFLEPTDTQTVERLNAWYDSRGVGRAYLSPYDSLPIQRQFRLYYVSH